MALLLAEDSSTGIDKSFLVRFFFDGLVLIKLYNQLNSGIFLRKEILFPEIMGNVRTSLSELQLGQVRRLKWLFNAISSCYFHITKRHIYSKCEFNDSYDLVLCHSFMRINLDSDKSPYVKEFIYLHDVTRPYLLDALEVVGLD